METSPTRTPDLYPEIEPYAHGILDVGDGCQIYWETWAIRPANRPWWFMVDLVQGARRGFAGCSILARIGSSFSTSATAVAACPTPATPRPTSRPTRRSIWSGTWICFERNSA